MITKTEQYNLCSTVSDACVLAWADDNASDIL